MTLAKYQPFLLHTCRSIKPLSILFTSVKASELSDSASQNLTTIQQGRVSQFVIFSGAVDCRRQNLWWLWWLWLLVKVNIWDEWNWFDFNFEAVFFKRLIIQNKIDCDDSDSKEWNQLIWFPFEFVSLNRECFVQEVNYPELIWFQFWS
jgi:hypothetical protein